MIRPEPSSEMTSSATTVVCPLVMTNAMPRIIDKVAIVAMIESMRS